MLKIKRNLVLLFTIIMVVGLVSVGFAAEREFIGIATGGTGGGYYPLGGAVAQMLSNNLDGIIVTAQTSNASRANCNLIEKGQIETAFVCSHVANWSYTGTEIYKDEPPITNLRGIASLYQESIHIFVGKNSGIKTIEDLRGKKVSIGSPNSGDSATAKIIFGFYGLTFDDFIPQWTDYNEAIQRFADGQVDAVFFLTGYPSSSVLDIESKREIELISFGSEKIKEIVDKYSYFQGGTIPAGIYKSITEPISTINIPSLWICDAKLSNDLVYKITKALWEHRDILEKVTYQGRNIRLETALDGMGIPLHPGAELYYKEVGLIK